VRESDENGAVLGEQAFSSDAGVKILNVNITRDGAAASFAIAQANN
jgi:hypothetical protein